MMPTYTFPLVNVPPVPAGTDDDANTRSAIQTLKRSFLLDTAEGDALTVLGVNYGVPRSPYTDDDEIHRRIIPALAWQPKTIKFTTYALLTAVFGSQADITTSNGRAWQVYEPNANEFVLEIPFSLLVTSNENASFAHGASGYAFVTAGPTATFTAEGNHTAAAVNLVGLNIDIFYSNVWNTLSIVSASYSAVTNRTTIQVNTATIPTGGGRFVIDVPGNGVSSYAGDYLAASAYSSSFSTAVGPPTNTISVLGDATTSLAIGHTVKLSFGSSVSTYTINSLSYSPTTNRSTIVMTASTITGGLSGCSITKALEEADSATTPGHALRVYLTGDGLLDVVTYYMDLLVRAAGIVMRVELI